MLWAAQTSCSSGALEREPAFAAEVLARLRKDALARVARRPLCIDLYCGLGGWAEGFLSEGYDVIGFDIEQRPYPGQLVLQDVRTLHGRQLKDAAVIVGSSPCQEFSYRAMPWKRAKALPPPVLGVELFNAQFRIQQQASEAAGRHIPMVVENVNSAQQYVGRACWHYGSYYLWGDVPALMPFTQPGDGVKRRGHDWNRYRTNGLPTPQWNTGGSHQKASALTAKIPFDLAAHIARCFKPEPDAEA